MKCKGSDCKCQVSEGEYCSDDCKTTSGHGHCHCGHVECH
jgi:hypothetical protein